MSSVWIYQILALWLMRFHTNGPTNLCIITPPRHCSYTHYVMRLPRIAHIYAKKFPTFIPSLQYVVVLTYSSCTVVRMDQPNSDAPSCKVAIFILYQSMGYGQSTFWKVFALFSIFPGNHGNTAQT